MFNHNAFLLETITNTHVGAGDTNYGVIDNMIQRDSRSGFPVVHSSSLKGAIRDHFKQLSDETIQNYTLEAVFGEESQERLNGLKQNSSDTDKQNIDFLLNKMPRQGLMKFFEANLLTLPLRSTKKVFHHATCPYLALDYLENLKQFKVVDNDDTNNLIRFFQHLRAKLSNVNTPFIVFSNARPEIEDYENGLSMAKDKAKEWDTFNYDSVRVQISKYFSPHQVDNYINAFAVFNDDLFQHICTSGLPVIARNKLSDKGTSENLFYEEILPRRSVLWFMNGIYQFSADAPAGDFFQKQFALVESQLQSQSIQIGANASVGYGVTSIHRINGGKTDE